MPLTEHTRQIIRLAWARTLQLDDFDLERGDPGLRLEVVDDDAASLSFTRLFDRAVLSGPEALLDRARSVPDEQLADETRLLALAAAEHPGARIAGETFLLCSEEPPEVPPSPVASGAISFEPGPVGELLEASPADDVAASGLPAAEWAATLVDESDGTPLTAAGRRVQQMLLGELGVLTAPAHRGRGLAAHVGAVAVEEAFVDGLVPQWRAAVEAPASRRLAHTLGFVDIGARTTVTLA